jgi:hypothetical protein
MTRWLYLARFFFVVPPMPLLMVGALLVVTGVSAVVILVEPARAAGALRPILLLQLFACSSGFDVPARRGHYDLLLTRGEPRRRVIVAHWAASALPGVICWALLAIVGYAVNNSGSRAALLHPGTLSALLLVSTIPWATTARLPRFSGAIGWLLILAMLSLAAPRMLVIDLSASIAGWGEWLRVAWAVLVYPPLLVGQSLGGRETLVVLPGLLFAVGVLLASFWSVNRRDIPLEAAQ